MFHRVPFLATLLMVTGLQAQTVTDDFSSATNWSAASSSSGTYAYTSNWEAQVDVHAGALRVVFDHAPIR